MTFYRRKKKTTKNKFDWEMEDGLKINGKYLDR